MDYKFNSKTRKFLTAAALGIMLAAPCASTVMAADATVSTQAQTKTLKDGVYNVDLHAFKIGSSAKSMADNFIKGAEVTVRDHQIAHVTVHFDMASFSKVPVPKSTKLADLIQKLSINGVQGTKSNISSDGKTFDFDFDGRAYKAGKGSLAISINMMGIPLNENANPVFGALPNNAYEVKSSTPTTPANSTSVSLTPAVDTSADHYIETVRPKATDTGDKKKTSSKTFAMNITKTGSKAPSEAAMFLGKSFKVNYEKGKPVSFSLHVDGSKSKMTKGQDMTKMIPTMSINGVDGKQENVNKDHSQFDFVFPCKAYKAGKGTLAISLNVMGHQMNEKADIDLANITAKKPAKTNKSKKSAKTYILKHNACLYNNRGKRIGKKVLKPGKKLKVTGTKRIKGVTYCQIGKNTFVKAGNVTGNKRKLRRYAYVYHRNGKHYGKLLRKGRKITTYGNAIKLHGKRFYHISANTYVKVANF